MSVFVDKRVYISGPMAGMPDHNGDAFFAAQETIQAAGGVAVNPHRLFNLEKRPTREQAMRVDLQDLLRCDAAYMLRGWEDSQGALLEHEVAAACGLEIRYEGDDGNGLLGQG